ncbi:hypothetical protein O6H91_05G128900 [Diphasiastrum complanatum]|uniref:Uncharacterized protein n=1 Tax=Diphasiastrum complanatum TaxID=34168 RepID=A0ACC2DTM7_DIPCM|nr:hypothetical protein O6H91_05G128900 [Diphasiastrum complanatum]
MQHAHMATYAGSAITTELIQKYLDENKQLILAILDNQNLGKLRECAAYQSKLQQNLMYLAAIADAQPQAPPTNVQVAPSMQVLPSSMMQSGQHYMQQQPQQVSQQSLLGQVGQNSLQYMQQAQSFLHSQQQQYHVMSSQRNIMPSGNKGMSMSQTDSGIGGNGPASTNFTEFSRGGNAGNSPDVIQTHIGLGGELRGGSRPDAGITSMHAGSVEGGSTVTGQTGDDSEPTYLKTSDEDGN